MGRRIGLAGVLRHAAATLVCAAATLLGPAASGQAPPPAEWIEGAAGGAGVIPARYGEPAAPAELAPPPYGAAPTAPALSPVSPPGLTPAPQRPPQPIAPSTPPAPNAGGPAPAELTPVGPPRVDRAEVSKGDGRLPNDAGQVWREYDIRPYTGRVAAEPRPQQRVVDWVLRETGYEAWHSDTLGILSATRDKLTVYHTPAMQGIVAGVVDRFVSGRGAERAFSMRIVTVRNPDWRVRALGLMTPIAVQSPGLQGWIAPKENYALIAAELSRRGDVRDYNATGQLVPNGHSTTFSTMRARTYIKGIIPTQQAWPGFQPESGSIEEGASLEFYPLLSLDLRTAEAAIKLRLTQVEKMRRVSLDLPSPQVPGASGTQRLQIEVPQVTMADLNERFRWPADQVLVLSLGMVATPGPDGASPLDDVLPDAMRSPPRADALLFVESLGVGTPTAGPVPIAPAFGRLDTAVRPTPTFNGRY